MPNVKPKLPAMKSGGADAQHNIADMQSLTNDIGEKSGFQTGGYLDKKGTPQGDGAMFNKMPPGMDISNQEVVDIRPMKLKTITDFGYEGDGGFPVHDVAE